MTRTRNTTRNTPTDTLPDAAPQAVKNPWRFWTIPNILSIIRLAMLAPTVWALVTQRNLLAFILFVVSSATDAVDGWVARRFHQKSEWGKILDPIADKLTLNTLAMIMAFQGRIPFFLALVVLVRDAIILGGGLVLLTSRTFVPQSNWPGKVTGLAFFAMLCAGLLDARWLLRGFLVPLVTVLVFITVVVYAHSFFQRLNQKSKEG
jgi:CDP-diacylglycerol--glycerol-3-phosphate 3-phosphatidyltransferase